MIPSGDIRRGEREKGQGDERGGRKGDEAPKGQTDHGTQWRGAPRGRTLTLTLKLHRNPNVGVCLFVFLFVVFFSIVSAHPSHQPLAFPLLLFTKSAHLFLGRGANGFKRLRAYRTTCWTSCEKERLPRERAIESGRVLEFDVQCLHWPKSVLRDTHASVARI